MSERDEALAARIATIKQEFLGRLKDEGVPTLRALAQRFRAEPTDPAIRTELRRVTHDLIGSGAVFGYEEISTLGRNLETILRTLLKQDQPENPETHAEILAMIERLTALCAATERDLAPSSERPS